MPGRRPREGGGRWRVYAAMKGKADCGPCLRRGDVLHYQIDSVFVLR